MTKKRIYLAGPLFSAAERAFNADLARALTQRGWNVFLPQNEVPVGTPPDTIFEVDRDGVIESDAVVAIVDGAQADDGTAWECGYAYALSIPVMLLRTDFRARGDDKWGNIMLTRSSRVVRLASPDVGPYYVAAVLDQELRKLLEEKS